MYDLLYIDPASGSYLVQAIIAAVLAVSVSFCPSDHKSISSDTKNDDNQPH